ncbi:hypothetical protein B4U79_04123 [Dinothrombium tinctorium]|uniref:Paramyosin-like protein n=1 Tax=Dinothrombium tinctorium TaxID=1965070 RepID=A0A3S3P471_9ACAR|nr:hypothetical protein B4U79_04123 [Dinothrombium tinctorium]
MARKQFTAPKVWRRPYTSIYSDNYRYGSSLYSGVIDDIERKYNESMARTRYGADRPDLHFQSFAGHAGSPGSPSISDSGTSPDVVANNLSMERCRELQLELNRLNNQVIDAESRIKSEQANVKGKLNMEIADLLIQLEEQQRINHDLDKTLKKQYQQIQDLQMGYESTQRAYADAMDMLSQIQRKASQLGHEVDCLRGNLDKQIFLFFIPRTTFCLTAIRDSCPS